MDREGVVNLLDLLLRDPNISPAFKRQFISPSMTDERRRDIRDEEHADQLREEMRERIEDGK